jgi:hypothetical protein
MKVFEIIYTKESEKLTLPYGSLNTYYVKDDNVCFSVDVYIETVKDIVESKSEIAVTEKYSNFNIVSIKHIGNKDYQFEAIAPDDYVKINSSDVLNSVKNGQRDRVCSEEVQEFQKNGKRIPHPTYSEF